MTNDPMRATDQRDERHKRARHAGDDLVQRALADGQTLTIEEERAIARRMNLGPRLPARSSQVDSGLYEPPLTVNEAGLHRLLGVVMEKPKKSESFDELLKQHPPSWFARMHARFDLWRLRRGLR